eukprot:30850-Pelagococcus_subviridis.AAC.55
MTRASRRSLPANARRPPPRETVPEPLGTLPRRDSIAPATVPTTTVLRLGKRSARAAALALAAAGVGVSSARLVLLAPAAPKAASATPAANTLGASAAGLAKSAFATIRSRANEHTFARFTALAPRPMSHPYSIANVTVSSGTGEINAARTTPAHAPPIALAVVNNTAAPRRREAPYLRHNNDAMSRSWPGLNTGSNRIPSASSASGLFAAASEDVNATTGDGRDHPRTCSATPTKSASMHGLVSCLPTFASAAGGENDFPATAEAYKSGAKTSSDH